MKLIAVGMDYFNLILNDRELNIVRAGLVNFEVILNECDHGDVEEVRDLQNQLRECFVMINIPIIRFGE